MMSQERILQAHGGGGELTRRLLAAHVLPRLGNEWLNPLTDGAILPRPGGRICFTTDAFVVQPLAFPGGDIGVLAVCGTVNDLAMMGARPLALSLAMVLEEGLPIATLDTVLDSVAAAARQAGVAIVAGDTKVIERGAAAQPGMTITTAGLGEVSDSVDLRAARVAPGDVVIISGRIAEHGLAVMSAREGLTFETELLSDVAPLNGLTADLLAAGVDVKFLRDPTRGGLAGLLADLADEAGWSVEIEEAKIPISPAALHTADLLGLDPLTVANEGKLLAVVPASDAETAIQALRRHPLGRHAALIGRCTDSAPPLVELLTRAGGRRLVQRPYGEELPRIC
ncbi:MAG: hydrogenase expression/formation protein HypE [Phycisphaerae bacterium]|nr:hydrogenase expression/formation protein HypE [Phycisphaerae bacterium]